MPAKTQTTSQILQETIEQQLSDLAENFPEAQTWIENYTAIHTSASVNKTIPSVSQKVVAALQTERSAAEYIQQISREEYLVVIEKLSEFMRTNATQVSTEALLYIEQQLSDLLGFTVTTELDNRKLQSYSGTMVAGQHLKRHPLDRLDMHGSHREAGLAPHRSAFGWIATQSPVDELSELRERYWVGVPVSNVAKSLSDTQRTLEWFKYRKVLVINPTSQSFVVAVIGDTLVDSPSKQFSGSPELTRSLSCWSPGSFGKVLVFFVDDESNQIPLGPVQLAFKTNGAI